MKKRIPSEDCVCEEGIIWNNADNTSGQWCVCEECEAGLSPQLPCDRDDFIYEMNKD